MVAQQPVRSLPYDRAIFFDNYLPVKYLQASLLFNDLRVVGYAACGNASQDPGGPVNIVVVRGRSLLQKREKLKKCLTLLCGTNCV